MSSEIIELAEEVVDAIYELAASAQQANDRIYEVQISAEQGFDTEQDRAEALGLINRAREDLMGPWPITQIENKISQLESEIQDMDLDEDDD